ncbi:uncharacterized protein LOC142356907, partial [Convolutriloba macropyga]|uniref:uncharacterized protein LOC142356907 n=1 Tax=Convolutriloba macropyga TaxID=536237 RepID=UPI003F5260AE
MSIRMSHTSQREILLLVMLCWSAGAIYEWGGETCSSLEQKSSQIRGTGCVGKGTIPTGNPNCKSCVFNYQCESGQCLSRAKKCYEQGASCSKKPTAGCKNCPSKTTADLSQCNCKNEDFPNNWVQCTNGSDWMDQYDLSPADSYKRKMNHDGSLLENDEFAIYSQCYHNKFRQDAAKLNPVRWNSGLASFATEWTRVLKETNNCKMEHSSGGQRKNIGGFKYSGENLFRLSTTGTIKNNDLPKFGQKAANGWYSEMKFYQYGGPGNTFGFCEYRNNEKGNAQVGHLTQ